MILSYHAVPTEEEMFFISRPLRVPFRSLSKKSGWSWAFSDRYGRIDKGDERCWNAGKWIETW